MESHSEYSRQAKPCSLFLLLICYYVKLYDLSCNELINKNKKHSINQSINERSVSNIFTALMVVLTLTLSVDGVVTHVRKL